MAIAAADNQPQVKPKVLIAEDDRFLQKILLMKFNAEGFDVRVASDGEDALRQLAEETPAFLVLDLIMPKKNGFEVLTEMKTDPKLKDVPVIVLSNLAQEADVARVKQLGAIDFLVKSNLGIQEVVQKVKEAYARHLAKKA